MDITASRIAAVASAALMVNIASVPAAYAGPNRAVEECKTAIAEENGDELMARLKKVRPRGSSYEIWLNLSDGDTQLKAFCLNKRGNVEIVTSEGAWVGSNLKRPAAS